MTAASTVKQVVHQHLFYQLETVTNGNICTHYLGSQQTNFLSTDFMAVGTNSTVSSVVAGINVVKIKTVGSGGTNGSHTGVDIRGDGSSGKN